MANEVTIDDAAVYDLTNGPDGPVTQLMVELSEQAAVVARARAHVRHTPSWSVRSDASPVGFMLASIRTDVRWYNGLVYGGAAAALDPTVFLEDPRVDRERYPFLTTGLDSLAL